MRTHSKGPREASDQRDLDQNSGHIVFDRIWKASVQYDKERARRMTYRWLADQLGIPMFKCHFSMMTEDQILQAIKVCRKATWGTVWHWHQRRDNARAAFGQQRKAS